MCAVTGGIKIYDDLIHIDLLVPYMIDIGDYIHEVYIYEVIWQCITFILCVCIALVKVNHGGLTKA